MLDCEKEIDSESTYSSVYQILTVKNFPTSILLSLMSVFEEYRLKRKIGWMRPWNMENLRIFKSIRWYPKEDKDLYEMLYKLFLQNIHIFDENNEYFIRDILNDRSTQGFLFYHDSYSLEESTVYEGVTLSLGRISSINSRFRDRIDIILESKVTDLICSQNTDKIRIFIDPYIKNAVMPPLLEFSYKSNKNSEKINAIFELLIKKYHLWENTEREWYHWSQKYISYFGERKNCPLNTLFFNKKMAMKKNSTEEKHIDAT